MPRSKLDTGAKRAAQSARFIEAAKAAGADQKEFERVFKKIVPAKKAKKSAKV
jgi:hypothetical protein